MSIVVRALWFVDPDLLRKRQRDWWLADEAVRVGRVGRVEDELTVLADRRGQAVVDHGWGHHADSGVAMVVVIPGKERVAEDAAILNRAEAIGKLGAIFQGTELAF